MRAYSLDLRQKVVEACEKGERSQNEVAKVTGVSLSFVEKLLRRKRTTGKIEALPHTAGPKRLLDEKAEELVRALVKERAEATLAELCESVHEKAGVRVSVSTMCGEIKRLGLVRKKGVYTLRSEIPKGSRRRGRASWRRSGVLTPRGSSS